MQHMLKQHHESTTLTCMVSTEMESVGIMRNGTKRTKIQLKQSLTCVSSGISFLSIPTCCWTKRRGYM